MGLVNNMHQHSRKELNCDIFIRSYYKDFGWLSYALRSVRKYCYGFSKIIVVVPESSRRKLDWLGLAGDVTIICPDYRDDYLGQQITKLTADLISDADFICHIDSDCIFQKQTRPEDLFERRKPRILMAPYARLDHRIPWKVLVESLLCHEVEFEFMRTPPYTFPRWLYSEFRTHILSLHGCSLDDYILKQPPRGFSEFNALGAFAYDRYYSAFHWLDEDLWGPSQQHCKAYWSWGGIDERTKNQLEHNLS
jgi:hypothetical protein